MKKINYAFLLIGIFASYSFAQKFPASSFPVGGFDISTLLIPSDQNILDSMKKIGFNTFYEADYAGRISLGSLLPSTMQLYMGMAYYPGELLTKKYVGDRFIEEGVEKRFFLASGLTSTYNSEKFNYEQRESKIFLTPSHDVKATNWKAINGTPQTNGEWVITANDPSTGMPWVGDILNLELDDPNPIWYNGSLNTFKRSNDRTYIFNDKIYVDFIFRFSGNPSGNLYDVTIQLTDNSNTMLSPITRVINSSDYSTSRTTYSIGSDNNYGLNNTSGLYYFPNNPQLTGDQPYAVLRINEIPDDTTGISIDNIKKVVITLKAHTGNSSTPIFVRGFRIRTRIADYILSNRGISKPTVGGGFTGTTMKQEITNNLFNKVMYGTGYVDNTGAYIYTGADGLWGPAYYNSTTNLYPKDRTPFIAGCGELTGPAFRTFAYLDTLWADYTRKQQFGKNPDGTFKSMHILPFLDENVSPAFPEYRAIYEDETGHPPPIILNEANFNATYAKGSGDPPFLPQDGILHSIRSAPGFTAMGFTIQPSTSTGYTNYTANMGENGYFANSRGQDQDAALSSLPTPLSQPTRWNALVSSISIITLHPSDSIAMKEIRDASVVTVRNGVGAAIKADALTSAGNDDMDAGVHNFYQQGYNHPWSSGDAIKASDLVKGLGTNTTLDAGVSPQISDPNKEIQMEIRTPIATEMRRDAWTALSWGAKGIFFNPIGNDGGANIGICDNYFKPGWPANNNILQADYDSWLGGGISGESGAMGYVTLGIGDCAHPFFTADPWFALNTSTAPDYNFTHRLIKFNASNTGGTGGSALSLPTASGKTLGLFQWIPIEKVLSASNADLNMWLLDQTSTPFHKLYRLYNNDGTQYGTLNQFIPVACSDCWQVVNITDCPAVGVLRSAQNYEVGTTITIGGRNYNLKSSLSSAGDILVDASGATDDDREKNTIANIIGCIDGPSVTGKYISYFTTGDPNVSASQNYNNRYFRHEVIIQPKDGVVANTIETSTNCSSCTNLLPAWDQSRLNAWESFYDYPTHNNPDLTQPPGPIFRGTGNMWKDYGGPATMLFKASLPTFYGIQERWNGARQIVNDLSNCANTLKDLNWIKTYSLLQVSLSGNNSILGINIISGGSGFTNGASITFGSGSAIAHIQTDPSNGKITGVVINNPGSGYTLAPTVTISGGTGAVLQAVIDNGALATDFGNNSPLLNITSRKYNLTAFPLSLRSAQDYTDPEDDPIGNPIEAVLYRDANSFRIDKSVFTNDDPYDHRLYEIGIFSHLASNPNQSKFVVVANKRTWPYYVDGTGNSAHIRTSDGGDNLLGAIDVREFRAFVDNSPGKWSGINRNRLKLFEVIDYRNPCSPQDIYPQSQPFHFRLDPGEGTLLSFTPIFGLPGVKCWPKSSHPLPINNGHHLSSLENSSSSQTFQMTCTKAGGVSVFYPIEGVQEGDSSLAQRHLGTPADSLIETNTHCADPVISAHPNAPTQLAVAYSVDSSGLGTHQDSTSVIFRIAATSTPYNYSYVLLDKFKTRTDNYTRATPVITPAKGCGKWWVAYRNPDKGGVIMLIDANGTIISQKIFSAGDPSTTRFITITSHLAKDTTVQDTVFMSFEEGPRQTGARVYYLEAFCHNNGTIDTTALRDLTHGLPYCEYHYPNIAMSVKTGVMVTWEAIASHFHVTDSTFNLIRTHYIMLDGRYHSGKWVGYLSFKAFDNPVKHAVDDTLSAFPVVTVSDYDAARINDTMWTDRFRLVWHSPFDEQAHISHFGYLNGGRIQPFEDVMMPDASLWPTSPVRTKYNGVLQPLMYTHPTYADDTLYTPEITIYDFPISTLQKAAVLKQMIIAKPKLSMCGMAVVGSVSGIVVRRDTQHISSPWLVRDTLMIDTVTQFPFNWNDSSLRSQNFTIAAGDTLSYGRYFRTGNYQPGDTNTVKGYLYNSSDYVSMQVNLRNASTHALIKTIDSCMLYSGGFYQSGSLADGGRSKTGFTSSISGSVFLSFDVMRGNSGNTFEVFNNQIFDDTDMIDFIPGPALPDKAFKRPEPKPQANAFVSHISVSVHPNPFRTETAINLEVPKDAMLNVTVFDVLGKQVTNLFNNYSDQTNYSFTLGRKELQAGMYIVRVQCGSQVVSRKIELLR